MVYTQNYHPLASETLSTLVAALPVLVLFYLLVVRRVLAEHPVILVLQAFDRQYGDVVGAHPDWEVAPGVAVAQGPRPAALSEAEGLPALKSRAEGI